MTKKYNNKEQQRIINRVMSKVRPMLEQRLMEISSSYIDKYADRAESMPNQGALTKRLRDAADARRQEELYNEYENSLNEIDTIQILGEKFIVAEYIPANMNVLIYFPGNGYAAIVEIADVQPRTILRTIPRKEICEDIASVYKSRSRSNPLGIIASALDQNRNAAHQLAERINADLDTNLGWRWFNGDPIQKREVKSTEGDYKYLVGEQISGKTILISKIMTTSDWYAIYYVLVGDAEQSCMMRIYETKTGPKVQGHGSPSPIWKTFKREAPETLMENLAQPTRTTSNITNIYDMFNALDHRTRRNIFDYISKSISLKITMSDVEDAFDAQNNGGADTDKEVNRAAAPTDVDDVADFM